MYQKVAVSEPAEPRGRRASRSSSIAASWPPWLALTRRAARIASQNRPGQARSQERETGARGRSHREVIMRFSDEVIASYLNDEWRTPPDVHRLLNNRGND